MNTLTLPALLCVTLAVSAFTSAFCGPVVRGHRLSSPQDVPARPTAPSKSKEGADAPVALPLSCQGKILREHPAHFDKKMIALTFDDGPDPRCTPRVLDALAKYHAHATFFVVGKEIPGREKLLQRMVAEGHVVGNHTYDHAANPPSARAHTELNRTDTLIIKATGIAPSCFRPPYGRTDTVLVAQAKKHGYGIFLWTIDPGDTRGNGTNSLIRGVLRAPENGDIVILHDGNNHQASAAAVAPILKSLSAKGWQFVTLPEMMVAWDTFHKAHPKSVLTHKTSAHRKKRSVHKRTLRKVASKRPHNPS